MTGSWTGPAAVLTTRYSSAPVSSCVFWTIRSHSTTCCSVSAHGRWHTRTNHVLTQSRKEIVPPVDPAPDVAELLVISPLVRCAVDAKEVIPLHRS